MRKKPTYTPRDIIDVPWAIFVFLLHCMGLSPSPVPSTLVPSSLPALATVCVMSPLSPVIPVLIDALIVVLWWSLPVVLVLVVVVVLHCTVAVVGARSSLGGRSPLVLVIAVIVKLVPEKCT
jgi:hypothetical protein